MNNSILSESQMAALAAARAAHHKIVLVTGVFDLLHEEHKRFLKKAKALGEFLIVGIESDARVRQLKGDGRPINDQHHRLFQLEKTTLPDLVFILPEQFSRPEDHRALMSLVRPDFFAVSSHTSHIEKKRAIVEEFGGQLVIAHQHNPAVSTTRILAERARSSQR